LLVWRLHFVRREFPVTDGTVFTAMNDKKNSERSDKAQYQSPQVTRVSLRPEEAVLGHCKTAGMAGPISAQSCSKLFCRTLGS